MSGPAPDRAAYLTEDEASFAGPRRQALSDCMTAFLTASTQVKGAEARVRQAVADLTSLNAFGDEVDRLNKHRAFQDLPAFRQGRERFSGYHHLTVGPWRGVFLVNRIGDNVVAVVFSRHPHALEQRLDEIFAPYRAIKN